MKRCESLFLLWSFLLLMIGLPTCCSPTTVAIPLPTAVTATPAAPAVPPPTETIAPPLSLVAPLAATPLATAPAVRFAGWSPDSRWVAYWVSSQEDVDGALAYWPVGILHFANVETGETCAVPELVSQDSETIGWSDDGAAIVSTAAGWFSGWPCQTEPYAALTDYAPNERQTPDPALSPDGRCRVTTVLQFSEDGIETFETTITFANDTRSLQSVTWRTDQRLGEYGLGGEWVSRSQFLIYESLAEGPLLIDAGRGVIPVATELFGLQEIPSILDKEGYGFRAIAIPGAEPDGSHLLLAGVGAEGNFPRVMLYHAEDGLVETLPYRYVWWEPFSADHEWLLMDARPTVGGHESHEILIRRVEGGGGEWQSLATGVDSALWNAEWTAMAFSDDSTVTWLTFPDGDLIGRWDTGQFWTHPAAWSPDGRFLVAEGNAPGLWQYGLFLLESPMRAPGTMAAIDCADTTPFPPQPTSTTVAPSATPTLGAQGMAAPAGLVYSTVEGLWRVGVDGRSVLLSDRSGVILSPEALRGTGAGQVLFPSDGIWLLDLATGEECNLTSAAGRAECCPQWWPARPDVIVFGSWPPDVDLGPSIGFLTAIRTDGSDYRVLDGESQSNAQPAPGPDGRTIAYDRGGTAWLYHWDVGPEMFDLAAYDFPTSKSVRVGSPAWSPDGKRLAWAVGGNFGKGWQIGVGVFDLEARTSLLLHPYGPVGVGGWPAAPLWSPDGQWLAYNVWPAQDPDQAGLWVFSAEGKEEHFLGTGTGPQWGPEGQWLSFSLESSGLWLADVGTWRLRQIDLPDP